MNVIERWKQRAKVQAAHEEEINTLHTEYTAKIRAIKDSHKRQLDKKNDDIVDIEKAKSTLADMCRRDSRNLKLKLDEAEQKIESFQQNHERMEALLTKLEKRVRIYRDMRKAVDAWEEEIGMAREEEKMEEFIKWKNERGV
jgi:hypothetical protein